MTCEGIRMKKMHVEMFKRNKTIAHSKYLDKRIGCE